MDGKAFFVLLACGALFEVWLLSQTGRARAISRQRVSQHSADALAAESIIMSQPPACVGANYVTLLTGARYAAPAACLPHQLRRVGALVCPVLLVYNDSDPLLPLPLLEAAYGLNHMLPLSRLHTRVATYSASQRANESQHATHGRRLFSGNEMKNTHLKLWLWALIEYERLVFLDIDIVILRNVSDLLTIQPSPMPDGQRGIAATTCKSKYENRYFNSGIVVFSPSLQVLGKLLDIERFTNYPWNGYIPSQGGKGSEWIDICAPRDDPGKADRMPEFALAQNSTFSTPFGRCRSKHGGRSPHRMPKACEQKFTDQSILNHIYTSHTLLEHRFNDNNRYALGESHIVHFVGERKPWDPSRDKFASAGRRNATQVWLHRCARFIPHAPNGSVAVLGSAGGMLRDPSKARGWA